MQSNAGTEHLNFGQGAHLRSRELAHCNGRRRAVHGVHGSWRRPVPGEKPEAAEGARCRSAWCFAEREREPPLAVILRYQLTVGPTARTAEFGQADCGASSRRARHRNVVPGRPERVIPPE